MPFFHIQATLLFLFSLFSSPSVRQDRAPCAAGHSTVLYAPQTNLEESEMESLQSAKRPIDVAMYSFTDLRLAEELVKLAHVGVIVRVYRDGIEYEQEKRRGKSTTEVLVRGGVAVRIKSSRDLMHFKSYVADGTMLRTGSANWSKGGLLKQDNDVHYEIDPSLAGIFETRFSEMWDRPTNLIGGEWQRIRPIGELCK
jgi:phosphatidylserine/phosphatidylglycerophosphate/cardiolipin synthase-like enzyme